MRRGEKKPAGSAAIGVRALKNQTSAVLRRVRGGESVTITDRQRPVAVLVPIDASSLDEIIRWSCRGGRLAWSGGKPAGCPRPPRISGDTVAAAVIEDRR